MISLRPATLEDYEFAFGVKKRAMWIFPPIRSEWDDEAQHIKVREKFNGGYLKIIMIDGNPIGTVGLVDQGESFRVSQFFIEPQYHNRGIGSIILKKLLSEADGLGKKTFVRVGIHQQSSIAFYKKHGFIDSGNPVDTDECWLFLRPAPI